MQINKRLVWDVIALGIASAGFWYQLSVHRSQPSSILPLAGMACAGVAALIAMRWLVHDIVIDRRLASNAAKIAESKRATR